MPSNNGKPTLSKAELKAKKLADQNAAKAKAKAGHVKLDKQFAEICKEVRISATPVPHTSPITVDLSYKPAKKAHVAKHEQIQINRVRLQDIAPELCHIPDVKIPPTIKLADGTEDYSRGYNPDQFIGAVYGSTRDAVIRYAEVRLEEFLKKGNAS